MAEPSHTHTDSHNTAPRYVRISRHAASVARLNLQTTLVPGRQSKADGCDETARCLLTSLRDRKGHKQLLFEESFSVPSSGELISRAAHLHLGTQPR